MSGVRIRRFDDVRDFSTRARPFLMAAEAENNLLLGIVGQLLSGEHAFQDPIYLATVEDSDEVLGCAFRTPPHKVGLTRMPEHAVPQLVEDVARVYHEIPAVMGPKPTAIAFGQCWTDLMGGSAELGMRMGIYQVEEVAPPSQPAPGRMRPATREDLPQIEEWAAGFAADSGAVPHDPEMGRRLIDQEDLFLWQDEVPRSMAAATGPTPNGIRIGYVYTPPDCRGHGYGSIITARLSQHQLDLGRRFCFLYTDLGNRTSNSIYRRIGYRQVSEVVDLTMA